MRTKKQKLTKPIKPDIQDIKIKTLDEIRAEKLQKLSSENEKRSKDELEVSSTSVDDISMSTVEDLSPKRKIKLRRKPYIRSDMNVSSCDQTENTKNNHKEMVLERNDSNKTEDEVLLLEGDDEYGNVSLKTEDDLLNEIDYLLNE